MKSKHISASILSANFATLGQEATNVINAGASHIHFDVMDHHFVPNLSFGAVVCQSLRDYGITAPIDVHLMTENPEQYIEPFAKAGANLITFHPETVKDCSSTLQKIKAAGLQAGLAFNPSTKLTIEKGTYEYLDMLLIMSVQAGFGGQKFIPESLHKIKQARELLTQNKCDAWLGVDGGINLETISGAAKAGADYFVIGSGLFGADDYQKQILLLNTKLPTN